MKKLWAILAVLFVILGFLYFHVFAGITQDDSRLIDRTEEKIFQAIDSEKIKAEQIIKSIDIIVWSKQYSERVNTLLLIIKDDIQWRYYLWAYAEDDYEMLPEDCYEDEYYDENDKSCYFDESYIHTETQKQDYLPESPTHYHEDVSLENFTASYKISGDTITLIDGKADERYSKIWEIFSFLIPLNARWDFLYYKVIDGKNSDTAAYVVQDENNNLKWNIVVNLEAMYAESGKLGGNEAYTTLIHEFAHVLTLSSSQMRYYPQTDNEALLDRFAQNCTTHLLQEGCLREAAYLDDFIDTFWTDSKKVQASQEGKDVYTGNESNFVTAYAATNPGEDIAESFAYYVMKANISGKSIADKKMKFFDNYKRLKNLRLQIRNSLSQMK